MISDATIRIEQRHLTPSDTEPHKRRNGQEGVIRLSAPEAETEDCGKEAGEVESPPPADDVHGDSPKESTNRQTGGECDLDVA